MQSNVTRISVCLLGICWLGLGSGCSVIEPVQPWEKGNLAKPEMVFDEDALDRLYVEHTYTSKEAASGGAGVGGGGCGCN